MKTEPSLTAWQQVNDPSDGPVIKHNGTVVAQCINESFCREIASALQSHAALVEACEDALETLKAEQRDSDIFNTSIGLCEIALALAKGAK